MDKNTAQNAPKHAISSENSFSVDGPSPLFRPPTPVGEGYCSPYPPLATNQAFWVRPSVPQNSSQIYATGNETRTPIYYLGYTSKEIPQYLTLVRLAPPNV